MDELDIYIANYKKNGETNGATVSNPDIFDHLVFEVDQTSPAQAQLESSSESLAESFDRLDFGSQASPSEASSGIRVNTSVWSIESMIH